MWLLLIIDYYHQQSLCYYHYYLYWLSPIITHNQQLPTIFTHNQWFWRFRPAPERSCVRTIRSPGANSAFQANVCWWSHLLGNVRWCSLFVDIMFTNKHSPSTVTWTCVMMFTVCRHYVGCYGNIAIYLGYRIIVPLLCQQALSSGWIHN